MQYLLLIYEDEKVWGKFSDAEKGKYLGEYAALTAQIKQGGHHLGSAPLQPTETATTVRVREGRTVSTHGPFAETREQLGGFYLIEAKDLDEATAIAAKIPSARWGSIEVRPIMKLM